MPGIFNNSLRWLLILNSLLHIQMKIHRIVHQSIKMKKLSFLINSWFLRSKTFLEKLLSQPTREITRLAQKNAGDTQEEETDKIYQGIRISRVFLIAWVGRNKVKGKSQLDLGVSSGPIRRHAGWWINLEKDTVGRRQLVSPIWNMLCLNLK